jgi:L-2-hydroxyglutarate oxidase LhgO
LIYPIPDPRYPFLGVHFTPRVDGSVDIGPNAVLALSREGYRWRDASLRCVAEIVRTPGFAAMAQRHWRTGVREVTGSLSKKVFVARARSFVPSLQASDVVVAQAGVRAQALDRAGELVDDFTVEVHDPVVLVRNAPSPAATSSLAIAEAIVDRVVAMRAP